MIALTRVLGFAEQPAVDRQAVAGHVADGFEGGVQIDIGADPDSQVIVPAGQFDQAGEVAGQFGKR